MARMGNGYWLNPRNGKWIQVVRHELAILDPKAMKDLGATDLLADTTKQHSVAELFNDPYGQESIEQLRMLGVKAGLVRIRDYGNSVSVQFMASSHGERRVLAIASDFLESQDEWRPHVVVGNLTTGETKTYSREELLRYVSEGVKDIVYSSVLNEKLDRILAQHKIVLPTPNQ